MQPSFLKSYSKDSRIYTGTFPIVLGGAINCAGGTKFIQYSLPTEDCSCEAAGYSSVPTDCINATNLIDVACINGSVLNCYQKCCLCEDLGYGYTTNSISISTGNPCTDLVLDELFTANCNGFSIPCYRPVDLPFDRTDPDMVIWLKPDHGVTLNPANDNLLNWCDFSSSHNDSIYIPTTYKKGEINGYPYFGVIGNYPQIVYDITTANNYDPTGNNMSLVSVFKSSDTTPTVNTFPINIGAGQSYKDRGIAFAENKFGMHYYGGVLNLNPAAWLQICPAEWYCVVLNIEEGLRVSAYINGVFVGITELSLPHKTGYRLYGVVPDSTSFISEILAFKRLLTTSEIDSYQNYLLSKYSITPIHIQNQKNNYGTYFRGFVNCGYFYKRFTFTDWDTPLFGVGIQPDTNVGPFTAPSYRVDGHVTFEALGDGRCVVINSTGSELFPPANLPIGTIKTVAWVQSTFAPNWNVVNDYYASPDYYGDINHFKLYLEDPLPL